MATTPQLFLEWLNLFLTRQDLRFTKPRTISAVTAPSSYPADAQAFAKAVGNVSFAWQLTGEAEGNGGLFLDLSGEPASLDWLTLDGKKLSSTELAEFYDLDLDGLGTGHQGWFRIPKKGKPGIVWSLEDPVKFDSLDHYLQVGARRAFAFGWQWAQLNPLDGLSAPASTSLEDLGKALKKRGASKKVADALLDWLGTDARHLVPAPPQPKAKTKPAEQPLTLLTYRVDDLPPALVKHFKISKEVRGCLFWTTRGGKLPVIEKLLKKVPEQLIPGLAEGMTLAKFVEGAVATVTDAHVAVKAQGSFSSAFHSGDAAKVEAFLRDEGVKLEPIGPFLDGALLIHVANASAPDAVLSATSPGDDPANGAPLWPRAPRLYALDRGASEAADCVVSESADGHKKRARLRAKEVPPGQVAMLKLK